MPIATHPESGIRYCTKHFAVVDAACASCEAETRPPLFVDHTAIRRWRQKIDSTPAPDSAHIAVIRRIVSEGHEVPGTGAFPTCTYHVHDAYPEAVVVVKADGEQDGPAAITVMLLSTLERLRAEAKARS